MSKNSEVVENVIAKKRGRKPKKVIEEANQKSMQTNESENIIFKITENDSSINDFINSSSIDEVLNENDIEKETETNKPTIKKRGRKPKGGKIIQQLTPIANMKEIKPNVILHLKCSIKDITNSTDSSNLESFSFLNQSNLSYGKIETVNPSLNDLIIQPSKCDYDSETEDYSKDKECDVKDTWKKLKVLEHNLHINNIDNKKSACFWDTCEFDNPPVYIPKCFINDTYQVYGCFCSPECAVAHLMDENIDSSIKFERYQLINHIYSKVYNYNKNIKPAPNPYYMLEKYCGNLTIQEYRSLLQNERLFLVVDKPLTRVMPELHEDNDDFIINNKIIPTNNFKVKKLQRKQTKTNILSERFGLA